MSRRALWLVGGMLILGVAMVCFIVGFPSLGHNLGSRSRWQASRAPGAGEDRSEANNANSVRDRLAKAAGELNPNSKPEANREILAELRRLLDSLAGNVVSY